MFLYIQIRKHTCNLLGKFWQRFRCSVFFIEGKQIMTWYMGHGARVLLAKGPQFWLCCPWSQGMAGSSPSVLTIWAIEPKFCWHQAFSSGYVGNGAKDWLAPGLQFWLCGPWSQGLAGIKRRSTRVLSLWVSSVSQPLRNTFNIQSWQPLHQTPRYCIKWTPSFQFLRFQTKS